MIQDFPKRFEEYKRTVHELEELLADRGDPKDNIKRRMDIGALGIEQGEFTRQLVCIKRIQRAQELGKEDKSKAQALTMLEFEDFNPEQMMEIAEYKAKSLPSSPTTESQVASLIAKSVTMPS